MRVIHVTAFKQFDAKSGLAFGGLQRVLHELIPAQRRLGLDVDAVDMTQDALADVDDAVSRRDWATLGGVGHRVLGKASADVFHFHDWYGAAALEHLYRQGHRALVVTSHLPLRRGFTYRDSGVSWQNKSVLEDRCLRAARIITAPSNYTRLFLADEYGVSSDRLKIIPHGVDSTIFCIDPSCRHEDRQLLAVGRMTEQKGFELLVRAMPFVLAAHPGIRLSIIGDGARRDCLQRLIADRDLADKIRILDARSKEELVSHFANATLLVMPSQFEPFGLVGLEAMACGCPVLAVEPTGASEYLEPQELTTAYSPHRLGEAVNRRLDELRQYGASRETIRCRAKDWTWENAARRYQKVYSECLR